MPMGVDEEFSPDDFRVESEDGGRVRLVWARDSGERRAIVLDSAQFRAVAREVQKQVEGESAVSTNVEALLSRAEARVAGLGFVPEPDHFRLTVYIEAAEPGQSVEMSLRFTKDDLVECVTAMLDWLERSEVES